MYIKQIILEEKKQKNDKRRKRRKNKNKVCQDVYIVTVKKKKQLNDQVSRVKPVRPTTVSIPRPRHNPPWSGGEMSGAPVHGL